jgi:sugar phosphate isomerase/epimerase
MKTFNRRNFFKHSAALSAGVTLFGAGCQSDPSPDSTEASSTAASSTAAASTVAAAEPLFMISLAEWSLNREVGECRNTAHAPYTNLDFPRVARELGVDAVEFVNQCFFDKAQETAYLQELKRITDGEGIRNLLIMCDREGYLGDRDDAMRTEAVEKHKKWVEAAQFLGCHSIRVNAYSQPDQTFEEQQRLAADGLRRLCEFADPYGINVIVENHGGLSSNGKWLAGVMEMVNHPRVGTLPDFGNFNITPEEQYDRYMGVEEMMPYAKAVSAKAMDFDENGECVETDYNRMLKIVLDAGYRGYLGVEYEGPNYSAEEGIRLTKALLERVRDELTPQYQG